MRAVDLAGAVADPHQMRRAVVPLVACRIDAGQRLLVREEQRLVRGVELGLADLRRRLRGEPARLHEIERLGQPVGELTVSLTLRRVRDKILVPRMDAVEVGIAALGKGAQQVEGRSRLAVGLDHPLRVGLARRGVELDAVDDVAAVGRQGHLALLLDVGRARLGELAGQTPDLHHRHAAAKGQHHRHLQQHLEHVADVVGVELGEAFGAVAALQQERLAGGDIREPVLQPPRLAGEDQRRVIPQRRFDAFQRGFIRIARNLPDRQAAPALRRPFLAHRTLPSPRRASLSRVGLGMKHLRVGGRSTVGDIRITGVHETRKPPRSGGFGENANANPRPPSCTGGTKIARREAGSSASWRGT